jgi:hypothetical protein
MVGPNRIDPTPVRISTNMNVERQTPKTDFGDRLKAGMETAGHAVANGAAVAAQAIPGGAIVSAAVSSVTTLANSGSSGQNGGVMSAQYAQTSGIVQVGGGTGGINTTVGAGGSVGGSTTASPNYAPQGAGGHTAVMQSDLQASVAENAKLMQVQMAMQRENQVFSTVSNVLKVRHDTVKNTIQNVR